MILAVAAVLCILAALPAAASARTITWEGEISIADTFTHTYALSPGGAYSGGGSARSTITHRYVVPRQATEVAPGSGPISVPIRYEPAPVDSHFSGRITVSGPDCGGFTRVDSLDASGQVSDNVPATGRFAYDPADDKLALEPVFNARMIRIPPATRTATSVFPCPPPGTPAPQLLGLGTPRYEDPAGDGDHRLTVRRDGVDLYVEGSRSFHFEDGSPGLGGFGFPVGSTTNFSPLDGAPNTDVILDEHVAYRLHGTLSDDPVTLAVDKQGTGDATVRSRPVGIDCGDDCTARFERGTAAVLEAEPRANTRIVRWEGAPECGNRLTCSVPMDGDKAVTLVLEAEECSNHETAAPEWSARVVLPRFPDAELFRFSPSFRYCWDQDGAQVTGAAGFGTVDVGVDTALLAAFGFDLQYDAGEEQVTFHGAEGSVTGDFEFHFNTLTLLNRFGFSNVTNKIIKDQLQKKLAKLLPKWGYGPDARGAIADHLAKLRFQAEDRIAKEAEKARRKFARVLGDPLAAKLTGFAVDKLNGTLAAWHDDMTVAMSSEQFVDKTATEISDTIAEHLLALIEATLTYEESVWTPTATIAVAPGGTPPTLGIAGFVNPGLTIRRER